MGIVQFQAIGAITESALRDWATMKPEEVEAVKNVMFKFVTQNANLPGYGHTNESIAMLTNYFFVCLEAQCMLCNKHFRPCQ